MARGTATLKRNSPARNFSGRSWLVGGGVGVAIVVGWKYAEVNLRLLFNRATFAAVAHFVAGSLPPDLSPGFLHIVANAVLLTVATAIASTVLSVFFAAPLGMLACSSLWRTGLIATSRGDGLLFRSVSLLSISVRSMLGFLRAVPDLMWALLFVAALGLGPLAGTLALALSYTGVLGRVYADVFDAVESKPLEALLSTGAGRVQIFVAAIWPQALPNLTAYTLYSFECCVRAAAVLGFVGAGGLGYEISLSMRLFDYRQVSTLLVAFVAILTLTDAASRKLRRVLGGEPRGGEASVGAPKVIRGTFDEARLMDAEGLPHAVGRNTGGFRRRKIYAMGLAVPAVAVSFYFSGFFNIVAEGALEIPGDLIHFAAGLVPPDLSLDFLRSLGLPLIQTLAIALLGTLLGVVVGAPLSLAATSRLIFVPREGPERPGFVSLGVRYAVYWGSRIVLSILRSIPELVWALICIIAIGIGPFAGTIALGLHTTGVLGKLYADTMEEVGMKPVEALRALGARPLQLLVWAIWPQTKQLLGSYTVLRWDMNLRAATILGLVGGGGLGQVMYNDVQLGFYPRVATLILLIYGLVMATDWAGTKIWTAVPE
jgi:phosphonate transport system permease protein